MTTGDRMGGAATVREAAEAVLTARAEYLKAANRAGHPGTPHDDWLRYGDDPPSPAIYGDCSACAGAEYGTESDLNDAYDALRAALDGPEGREGV